MAHHLRAWLAAQCSYQALLTKLMQQPCAIDRAAAVGTCLWIFACGAAWRVVCPKLRTKTLQP
jgi:hypothetical protein